LLLFSDFDDCSLENLHRLLDQRVVLEFIEALLDRLRSLDRRRRRAGGGRVADFITSNFKATSIRSFSFSLACSTSMLRGRSAKFSAVGKLLIEPDHQHTALHPEADTCRPNNSWRVE
jgi:hypothetical protein